jgi:tRNA(Arg) A34 adenosine deaminase TadA
VICLVKSTAVLSTDGDMIVAGGARDLTKRQQSLLYEYERPAAMPDVHAEITALLEAAKRGWRPRAIATTREICPECLKFLDSLGGIQTSPTTYIFPRQGVSP